VRALAACNIFEEVHNFRKCQFEATAALWMGSLVLTGLRVQIMYEKHERRVANYSPASTVLELLESSLL
jgi:hypothetical protein